jgi:hypothetical protein
VLPCWASASGADFVPQYLAPPEVGDLVLIDAFVRAVLGRSASPIDARTAAAWTAPGHLCALLGPG